MAVEEDGCYSMVGEDFYPDIQLGEFGLVNRTLEPASYLQVQPGDVVGYYQTRRGGENVPEGILHERDRTEGGDRTAEGDDEEVWYFSNTLQNPIISGGLSCPITVGPGRILSSFTDSSPILHVEIGR